MLFWRANQRSQSKTLTSQTSRLKIYARMKSEKTMRNSYEQVRFAKYAESLGKSVENAWEATNKQTYSEEVTIMQFYLLTAQTPISHFFFLMSNVQYHSTRKLCYFLKRLLRKRLSVSCVACNHCSNYNSSSHLWKFQAARWAALPCNRRLKPKGFS